MRQPTTCTCSAQHERIGLPDMTSPLLDKHRKRFPCIYLTANFGMGRRGEASSPQVNQVSHVSDAAPLYEFKFSSTSRASSPKGISGAGEVARGIFWNRTLTANDGLSRMQALSRLSDPANLMRIREAQGLTRSLHLKEGCNDGLGIKGHRCSCPSPDTS